MKKATRTALAVIAITAGLSVVAPQAEKAEAKAPAAWCKNGRWSWSSGRGTCSWNGGCVKTWTWRGYRCI